MADSERRRQVEVTEATANAERTVAQVRVELDKTRQSVIAETQRLQETGERVTSENQRLQEDVAAAGTALSVEKRVSAGLRRERDETQASIMALHTELERHQREAGVAAQSAAVQAERERGEASAAAKAAASNAERAVVQVRAEFEATLKSLELKTRTNLQAEVAKAKKAGAVASEGFRRARDEAQTRTKSLVAELAASERSLAECKSSLAKTEVDLRALQAELTAEKDKKVRCSNMYSAIYSCASK